MSSPPQRPHFSEMNEESSHDITPRRKFLHDLVTNRDVYTSFLEQEVERVSESCLTLQRNVVTNEQLDSALLDYEDRLKQYDASFDDISNQVRSGFDLVGERFDEVAEILDRHTSSIADNSNQLVRLQKALQTLQQDSLPTHIPITPAPEPVHLLAPLSPQVLSRVQRIEQRVETVLDSIGTTDAPLAQDLQNTKQALTTLSASQSRVDSALRQLQHECATATQRAEEVPSLRTGLQDTERAIEELRRGTQRDSQRCESRVVAVENRITAVEDRVTVVEGRIGEATLQLQRELTTFRDSTHHDRLEARRVSERVSACEHACTAHEETLARHDTLTERQGRRLGELAAQTETVVAAVAELSAKERERARVTREAAEQAEAGRVLQRREEDARLAALGARVDAVAGAVAHNQAAARETADAQRELRDSQRRMQEEVVVLRALVGEEPVSEFRGRLGVVEEEVRGSAQAMQRLEVHVRRMDDNVALIATVDEEIGRLKRDCEVLHALVRPQRAAEAESLALAQRTLTELGRVQEELQQLAAAQSEWGNVRATVEAYAGVEAGQRQLQEEVHMYRDSVRALQQRLDEALARWDHVESSHMHNLSDLPAPSPGIALDIPLEDLQTRVSEIEAKLAVHIPSRTDASAPEQLADLLGARWAVDLAAVEHAQEAKLDSMRAEVEKIQEAALSRVRADIERVRAEVRTGVAEAVRECTSTMRDLLDSTLRQVQSEEEERSRREEEAEEEGDRADRRDGIRNPSSLGLFSSHPPLSPPASPPASPEAFSPQAVLAALQSNPAAVAAVIAADGAALQLLAAALQPLLCPPGPTENPIGVCGGYGREETLVSRVQALEQQMLASNQRSSPLLPASRVSPASLGQGTPLSSSIHGVSNDPQDELHRTVRAAVDAAITPTVHAAIHAATNTAVDAAVNSAVHRAVDAAIGAAVDASVPRAVEEAVHPAVHAAVSDTVHAAVGEAVQAALNTVVHPVVQAAVVECRTVAQSQGNALVSVQRDVQGQAARVSTLEHEIARCHQDLSAQIQGVERVERKADKVVSFFTANDEKLTEVSSRADVAAAKANQALTRADAVEQHVQQWSQHTAQHSAQLQEVLAQQAQLAAQVQEVRGAVRGAAVDTAKLRECVDAVPHCHHTRDECACPLPHPLARAAGCTGAGSAPVMAEEHASTGLGQGRADEGVPMGNGPVLSSLSAVPVASGESGTLPPLCDPSLREIHVHLEQMQSYINSALATLTQGVNDKHAHLYSLNDASAAQLAALTQELEAVRVQALTMQAAHEALVSQTSAAVQAAEVDRAQTRALTTDVHAVCGQVNGLSTGIHALREGAGATAEALHALQGEHVRLRNDTTALRGDLGTLRPLLSGLVQTLDRLRRAQVSQASESLRVREEARALAKRQEDIEQRAGPHIITALRGEVATCLFFMRQCRYWLRGAHRRGEVCIHHARAGSSSQELSHAPWEESVCLATDAGARPTTATSTNTSSGGGVAVAGANADMSAGILNDNFDVQMTATMSSPTLASTDTLPSRRAPRSPRAAPLFPASYRTTARDGSHWPSGYPSSQRQPHPLLPPRTNLGALGGTGTLANSAPAPGACGDCAARASDEAASHTPPQLLWAMALPLLLSRYAKRTRRTQRRKQAKKSVEGVETRQPESKRSAVPSGKANKMRKPGSKSGATTAPPCSTDASRCPAHSARKPPVPRADASAAIASCTCRRSERRTASERKLAQAALEHSTRLGELQAAVAALTAQTTATKSDIAALQQQQRSLRGMATEAKREVGQLHSRVVSVTGEVETLRGETTGAAGPFKAKFDGMARTCRALEGLLPHRQALVGMAELLPSLQELHPHQSTLLALARKAPMLTQLLTLPLQTLKGIIPVAKMLLPQLEAVWPALQTLLSRQADVISVAALAPDAASLRATAPRLGLLPQLETLAALTPQLQALLPEVETFRSALEQLQRDAVSRDAAQQRGCEEADASRASGHHGEGSTSKSSASANSTSNKDRADAKATDTSAAAQAESQALLAAVRSLATAQRRMGAEHAHTRELAEQQTRALAEALLQLATLREQHTTMTHTAAEASLAATRAQEAFAAMTARLARVEGVVEELPRMQDAMTTISSSLHQVRADTFAERGQFAERLEGVARGLHSLEQASTRSQQELDTQAQRLTRVEREAEHMCVSAASRERECTLLEERCMAKLAVLTASVELAAERAREVEQWRGAVGVELDTLKTQLNSIAADVSCASEARKTLAGDADTVRAHVAVLEQRFLAVEDTAKHVDDSLRALQTYVQLPTDTPAPTPSATQPSLFSSLQTALSSYVDTEVAPVLLDSVWRDVRATVQEHREDVLQQCRTETKTLVEDFGQQLRRTVQKEREEEKEEEKAEREELRSWQGGVTEWVEGVSERVQVMISRMGDVEAALRAAHEDEESKIAQLRRDWATEREEESKELIVREKRLLSRAEEATQQALRVWWPQERQAVESLVTSHVTRVQTEVEEVRKRIRGMGGKLDRFVAAVTPLEASVEDVRKDITRRFARVQKEAQERVSAVKGEMGVLREDMHALVGRVQRAEESTREREGRISEASQVALAQALRGVHERLTAQQERLDPCTEACEALRTRVDSMEERASACVDGLTQLRERDEATQRGLAHMANEYAGLREDVSVLDHAVGAWQTHWAAAVEMRESQHQLSQHVSQQLARVSTALEQQMASTDTLEARIEHVARCAANVEEAHAERIHAAGGVAASAQRQYRELCAQLRKHKKQWLCSGWEVLRLKRAVNACSQRCAVLEQRAHREDDACVDCRDEGVDVTAPSPSPSLLPATAPVPAAATASHPRALTAAPIAAPVPVYAPAAAPVHSQTPSLALEQPRALAPSQPCPSPTEHVPQPPVSSFATCVPQTISASMHVHTQAPSTPAPAHGQSSLDCSCPDCSTSPHGECAIAAVELPYPHQSEHAHPYPYPYPYQREHTHPYLHHPEHVHPHPSLYPHAHHPAWASGDSSTAPPQPPSSAPLLPPSSSVVHSAPVSSLLPLEQLDPSLLIANPYLEDASPPRTTRRRCLPSDCDVATTAYAAVGRSTNAPKAFGRVVNTDSASSRAATAGRPAAPTAAAAGGAGAGAGGGAGVGPAGVGLSGVAPDEYYSCTGGDVHDQRVPTREASRGRSQALMAPTQPTSHTPTSLPRSLHSELDARVAPASDGAARVSVDTKASSVSVAVHITHTPGAEPACGGMKGMGSSSSPHDASSPRSGSAEEYATDTAHPLSSHVPSHGQHHSRTHTMLVDGGSAEALDCSSDCSCDRDERDTSADTPFSAPMAAHSAVRGRPCDDACHRARDATHSDCDCSRECECEYENECGCAGAGTGLDDKRSGALSIARNAASATPRGAARTPFTAAVNAMDSPRQRPRARSVTPARVITTPAAPHAAQPSVAREEGSSELPAPVATRSAPPLRAHPLPRANAAVQTVLSHNPVAVSVAAPHTPVAGSGSRRRSASANTRTPHALLKASAATCVHPRACGSPSARRSASRPRKDGPAPTLLQSVREACAIDRVASRGCENQRWTCVEAQLTREVADGVRALDVLQRERQREQADKDARDGRSQSRPRTVVVEALRGAVALERVQMDHGWTRKAEDDESASGHARPWM